MALETIVIKITGDTKEINSTISKLEKVGKVDKANADQFKKSTAQFKTGTKEAGNALSGLKTQALALGGAMVGAFAIQQVITKTITAIKDFEKAMSELSAITGATGEDLKFLEEQAKKIGRTTTISATEAVTAFKLMASAKPELLKAKEALAAVTDEAITLAEASGLDLPTAIENLGITLNSMQLAADEAGRVVNVLAAASQKGAKEVPFLTFALSKFGGVAALANVSIESSAAAIEILGKAIPQAETVGTNLRNVLITLQTEAAKSGRNFEGLSGELELLAPRLKDISFLEKTFGKENLLAIQTLISQRKELDSLKEAITGTNIAQEQQLINTDNLDSAIKRFNNSLEGLALEGSSVGNILTAVIDDMTLGINKLGGETEETKDKFSVFTVFIKGIGFQFQILFKILSFPIRKLNELFDITGKISEFWNNTFLPVLAKFRNLVSDTATKIDTGINRVLGITAEKTKEVAKETISLIEQQKEQEEQTTKTKDATLKLAEAFDKFVKRIQSGAPFVSREFKKAMELVRAQAADLGVLFSGEDEEDIVEDADFLIKKFQETIEGRRQLSEIALKQEQISQAEHNANLKALDDELKQAKLDNRIDIFNTAVQAEQQFFDIIKRLNQSKITEFENRTRKEERLLQDKLDNEQISEEQFAQSQKTLRDKSDRERAQLLTKQAQNDKAANIIAATINTAVAVTAALKIEPPAGIILAVIVGALGAVEIATIASQETPQFHKGKRAELSNDEIAATIRKDEYVMHPEASKKHNKELDAMLEGRFEQYVFERYQKPIIEQYSRHTSEYNFDDVNITRHQRSQIDLLKSNNLLLQKLGQNYNPRKYLNNG